MLNPQFKLDLNRELIIDNFAGGGGASAGIEMALGRHVDVAINHNPIALAMHTANHPQTEHLCESVWDIDPRTVRPNQPVGLLWLSPDCKHFSKAKGGKPVDKKIRGLAWVTLRWAAIRKPRIIMLENVEEFKTWGPVHTEGPNSVKPIKEKKGKTFKSFERQLKAHGYTVEHKELRACDYGAPTIRKRFFLIARCDGQPIVWAEQTHIDPSKPNPKKLKPWRTAAECIDWSIPCPSIFTRKKPLAENTLRRVAKGINRYVINNPKPFIVTMAHGEGKGKTKRWGSGVRESTKPLPTITATGGYAVATPFISEHANASNQRNMAANEPLRTQCAEVKGGHFSLVTSNMIKMRKGNIGSSTDSPLHTITSGGLHHAEVRAFLIKYYGTDGAPKLTEPLHTITTKDRFGLVTVKGELYQLADIGLRMFQPRELYRAQSFSDDYIIDHGINEDGKKIKLTKTQQVQMVGNSVPPLLAGALALANAPEMAITQPYRKSA